VACEVRHVECFLVSCDAAGARTALRVGGVRLDGVGAGTHGPCPRRKAHATAEPAEQTAWGIAGNRATRIITVDMLDKLRFSPDRITVAEGETVRRGDVLCEVETEKAIFEVEAPSDGVLLRIVAPAGSKVPIFSVIATSASAFPKRSARPSVSADVRIPWNLHRTRLAAKLKDDGTNLRSTSGSNGMTF